ncbi:MAG: deoxyhypusine synthase family protein [Candidatus Aenigmarchaeota archaeon]|nr:deoxyhypusine synthase family protein [Candidatus Aenigmarchaeota archaeon]
MSYVKDFTWNKDMTAGELAGSLGSVGFQGTELAKAAAIVEKMKETGAKVFLTFTSNMVTSGLRGFFAQLIELGVADAVVTTVGSVEEDIMRASGEQFAIGSFAANDFALHEEGTNRVGNLYISNKSYEKFEAAMGTTLAALYAHKKTWTVSEMLREIGLTLSDPHSILHHAAKHNVPVFCPAITDGAFGFHLFMFQQDHKDFMVDVVRDFQHILECTSHDEKKGIICLGGGVSKHYAIFTCLLNGGFDYAVYLTTSQQYAGSLSGATTSEAKSWGKIKDDSDAATVIGDVTITFPLVMVKALEELAAKGLLRQ